MKTKRMQIAVVGAGARGEAFARQLYEGTRRAELFGVCDIDERRLEQFCEYVGLDGVRRFASVEELLDAPGLDAVVVTTPEFTHAVVACAAMEAGKPVYLEKPLAHTVEDCHRIARTQEATGEVAFVGFNLRLTPPRQKLHDIVRSGQLGQLVHIEGLEQLSQAHGASFTRRFHRLSAHTGGLLNHKCSHDLDIIQWLVGHEHRITRVSSFGGTNVFRPEKQPAARCHECPGHIREACPYEAKAGFVFPVRGELPIYHPREEIYGGDLCVFSEDKDIVDNQTVIFEWDHGVTGSFNMQLFQNRGGRRNRVVGEKGMVELDQLTLQEHGETSTVVRVIDSNTGDVTEHRFGSRSGGHGGSDPKMIDRFIDSIISGDTGDSGLEAGIAATVLALHADQSRITGRTVNIPGDSWMPRPTSDHLQPRREALEVASE